MKAPNDPVRREFAASRRQVAANSPRTRREFAGEPWCIGRPDNASVGAGWRQPSDPEVLGRSTIGRAVREYRLANGWSQRQLGWLVGVNQSTVARLEQGTLSGMRLSTLARILGQVSAPPDALLLQQGPPAPRRRLPGADRGRSPDATAGWGPRRQQPLPSYSADAHRARGMDKTPGFWEYEPTGIPAPTNSSAEPRRRRA